MADILYVFENNVYLNITNACPCRCTFCIRNNGDSVGDAQSLWFKSHTPSFEEIKKSIDEFDFKDYSEVIFCGYGEPTCAIDNLLKTAEYLKNKLKIKVRLNTNGLSDLINKRETAKDICKNIDVISVSLNAPTAEKYNKLCNPSFGDKAFDEVVSFAKQCKAEGVVVKFSLVDVISKEDIDACQKLADEIKIPLRVRHYSEN
ncbi:MAG: TIGR04100 family radical SAM protein [Oscillospiraceae bacterium]